MTEEASLPDAVDELYAAVGVLVDPVKELVGGSILGGPSPYESLIGEIPAQSSGEAYSRGVGKSLPTIWCDAVDLRIQIDTRTKQLQPDGDSTPQRLRALVSRRWRPQDCRQVRDHAAEIQSWAASIHSLLVPEHVKQISAPCPNCSTRWVYRTHAGEKVRVPALTLVAEAGCKCLSCAAFWAPDKSCFSPAFFSLNFRPA